MEDWKSLLVSIHTSVIDVLKVIETNPSKIALVVDKNIRLLGTVTDGDVRRAMLKNISLKEPVQMIMNTSPTTASINVSQQKITNIMKDTKLCQIPILDEENCVVGLTIMNEMLIPEKKDNLVVLMAGGIGSRLQPLTNEYPKSLMKVGGKTILETIIENFIVHGFHRFYISVNYKSQMIEDYFGDGSKWGVIIHYLKEKKRLGTAGSLSLLPEIDSEPLIVMNGDLLTKINFQQFLDFHGENMSQATMAVVEYDFKVPYGVVEIEESSLISIDEKPVQNFFINAGVYLLEPTVLDYVPKNSFIDMTSIFKMLIEKGLKTTVFPIREYWLDIGQVKDLDRANGEYKKVFD